MKFTIDESIRYFDFSDDCTNNENPSKEIKERRIILCCPGFFASAKTLAKHISAITDIAKANGSKFDYSVIAIEWRGHGESGLTATSNDILSVPILADDLNQLISHLLNSADHANKYRKAKISLLGHSMGVNVIWHYIRKYGDDLIEKHIFVDQPVAITGGKDAFANGYKKEWIIHSLFTAYIISFFIFLKRFWLAPLLWISKPKWMSDETVDFLCKCSPYLWKLLIDTSTKDNTFILPLVRKPCLLISGKASFVSPDIAQFIKDRVSGPARVITYPAPYGTHAPFFGHYCKDQELGKYGERKFCEDAFAFLEEKVDRGD